MTNRYRSPQSPDFRLDYYVEDKYVSKLTATDEEIVSTIKSANLRKQIRKDVKDILNELVDLARKINFYGKDNRFQEIEDQGLEQKYVYQKKKYDFIINGIKSEEIYEPTLSFSGYNVSSVKPHIQEVLFTE